MTIQVIILAAGQGKRMCSRLPKVLHKLGGESLLEHVLAIARVIAPDTQPLVVVGHGGDQVKHQLQHQRLNWAEQKEQLGTGHAVLQALPHVGNAEQILILSGDVPLLMPETLTTLLAQTPRNALGVLTAIVKQPMGYGRIVRDAAGQVTRVVEEKDANSDERQLNEINAGVYLVPRALLAAWLPRLSNQNQQREYYLTDIIDLAVREQIPIVTVHPKDESEILGVNDRVQLACLERLYQRKQMEGLMRQGVTFLDPGRVDIRGKVRVGRDVTIDVNVILEGQVVIGDDCVIGAQVRLSDVTLGQSVHVKDHSVLEGAQVADGSIIGPFARLRPGTWLERETHIGNFVEVKNSQVGAYSKINHLSYIGDSDIGKRVNVGAGTITCNYDGANKHRTVIGDDVHIGSATQLVAPVTVGEGATLGAGSTLIKNAPAGQLTLTHKLDQRSIKGWERPKKQEKLENTK